MQGDLVQVDEELVAILSRSCDLPREWPEQVLVAPVIPTDNAQWLRGWDVRRINLPTTTNASLI